MGYYERIATKELADEFYAELRHYMQQAAKRPESFPIRERDLRRVNLQRFPYHFLLRMLEMSCGFSWSATTGDVPPLASDVSNVAQFNERCLIEFRAPGGIIVEPVAKKTKPGIDESDIIVLRRYPSSPRFSKPFAVRCSFTHP